MISLLVCVCVFTVYVTQQQLAALDPRVERGRATEVYLATQQRRALTPALCEAMHTLLFLATCLRYLQLAN